MWRLLVGLILILPAVEPAFAQAVKLVITGSQTQIAGTANEITITARDATDHNARSYTGDKEIVFSGAGTPPVQSFMPTVSDKTGQEIPFGEKVTITFDKGVAHAKSGKNGTLWLYKAETADISVSDGSIGSSGSGNLTVTVSPAAAADFSLALSSPQESGTAFTATNRLTAVDRYGNRATNFDASAIPVTLTTSLSGTITGLGSGGKNVLDRSGDFSSGVADLTGKLTYTGPAGTGTFEARTSNGITGTSSGIEISAAAAPGQLAIVQQPTDGTAGNVISPPVAVQLQDASGTALPLPGLQVNIRLSEGTGTLGGSTSQLTNLSGVAVFNDLTISQPGTKRLTASSTGFSSVESNQFSLLGTAARLTIQTQPSSTAEAGKPFGRQPVIRIEDASGNVVTADNTTVVHASRGSGTGTLQGTLSVTAVNGIASFTDLMMTAAGTIDIVFSSTPAYTQATSANVVVGPGPAATISFVQQPSNATAESIIVPAITVQSLDVFGNNAVPPSAVTMTLSTGTGTLTGTTTRSANSSGRAQFDDLRVSLPGDKQLTASSGTLTPAASNIFTISAGSATQLAFVQQPSASATGSVIVPPVTVQLKDAFGSDVLTDGVIVTMTMNGTGTLLGTTSQTTVRGLATFGDLQVDRTGTKTFVAHSSGLTQVSSAQFVVSSAAATVISVETAADGSGTVVPAQNLRSGQSVTLYAVGRDAAGNYVGNVSADVWTIDGPLGGVSTADLVPSGDKRSAVFTGRLAGSARVRAAMGSLDIVPSGLITVIAGPAASIAPGGGTPQTARVGTAFSTRFSALVLDAAGNPVQGVTVTFTPPASGASCTFSGGSGTAVTDERGIATAPVATANALAGSYVVLATVPGVTANASFALTNIAGTGARISIAAGDGQSAEVGSAFGTRFLVLVSDAGGNPVSGTSVTFTSPASGAGGVFGTQIVAVEATDGSGFARAPVFTANTISGSYTVTATAPGVVTPAVFTLTNLPGPLTRFLIEGGSGGTIPSQVSGQPFTVTVTAQDAFGNRVQSFAGTVDFTSTGALSAGGGTSAAFSAGLLSSHSLTISNSGTFTVSVKRTGGTESGISNSFAVGNRVPTIASVSPGNGQRGQSLRVTVQGTGFITGVSSASFGDGIFSSTNVVSATEMAVDLRIDPSAVVGMRNVSILNPPPGGGTATLVSGFEVLPNATPTLASISPTSGQRLQTLTLVCSGTNFSSAARIELGDGITVNSSSVSGGTSLTANLTIAPGAATGPRSVRLINGTLPGDTVTLQGAFSVLNPTPALTNVVPAAANPGATVDLKVRGQNFLAGVTTISMGQGITVKSFSVDSVGVMSVQIAIDTGAALGGRMVTVTNSAPGGGTASAQMFSVNKSATADVVAINAAYDFPARASAADYQPADYRIVGLPGGSGAAVTTLLPGSAGTDWQMYWDNGAASNFLVAFDAGPIFTFQPGRAFWLVKKGAWNVNTTVAAAPRDSAGAVRIALHPGWNLITNPYPSTLAWSRVQNLNGGFSDPLYAFNGAFSTATAFDPYAGYCFFNSQNLSALAIPPPSGTATSRPRVDEGNGWKVAIGLHRADGIEEHAASFGAAADAKEELDQYDYRKPRPFGDVPGVYFSRPAWDKQYSIFASDIRPLSSRREQWDFEVEAGKLVPINLGFTGVEKIPLDLTAMLFDVDRSAAVDLRSLAGAGYSFRPASAVSRFSILLGTREEVDREVAALLPREFSLGPNYPNPFNPSTTIPVTLASSVDVTLTIYNVIGEEVKALHKGLLNAGRHWFTWDGRNEAGIDAGSGVYFCRMNIGSAKTMVAKMMLVR